MSNSCFEEDNHKLQKMSETETCGRYSQKNQTTEAASTVMIKIQLLLLLLLLLVLVLLCSQAKEAEAEAEAEAESEVSQNIKKKWVQEVEKEAQQPFHLQLQAIS